MDIIKGVQVAPNEVLLQTLSPSGRFRIQQTWHPNEDSRTPITIEEVSTGKTVARIETGMLGPVAWAPKEAFIVIWIQGTMRPLTQYANTSYNQYTAINLATGKSVDLTRPVEEHFKQYFKPIFEDLEKTREGPDPGFSAYTQAYFTSVDEESAVMQANALGYGCAYRVRMADGSIADKNFLPPGSAATQIAAGNQEVIHRSDVVGEGDIVERREIFSPTGKRKWIDFYYMIKFGQPQKLLKRAYTREDVVKVVPMK